MIKPWGPCVGCQVSVKNLASEDWPVAPRNRSTKRVCCDQYSGRTNPFVVGQHEDVPESYCAGSAFQGQYPLFISLLPRNLHNLIRYPLVHQCNSTKRAWSQLPPISLHSPFAMTLSPSYYMVPVAIRTRAVHRDSIETSPEPRTAQLRQLRRPPLRSLHLRPRIWLGVP